MPQPISPSNIPATTTTTNSSGVSGQAAFCGPEAQISDHTCNSLRPAVSIDPFGAGGVVWHDTRNGTFDIYFKTVAHPLPHQSVLQGLLGTIDPITGRSVNVSCSGFSAYSPLSKRCDIGSTSTGGSNFIARHSGGILDVNTTARVIVLSGTRGENFSSEGVGPGSQIKIESGANAGDVFYVSQLLTNSIVELVYYDGPVSDTGFVYTIQSNPAPQSVCESRLTCNGLTNTYPDIQADKQGRFHIVWQAGVNGKDNIYYVQIWPDNVGELKCSQNRSLTIGLGQPIDPTADVVFDILTGKSSKAFSYGSSDVSDPEISRGGNILARTGFHRLFKDYKTDNKWTGVSDVDDYSLWLEQRNLIGSTIVPSYFSPPNNPLATEGDFGSKFDFEAVAFLAESPKEGKVDITKVILPLKPHCTPDTIPRLNAMREEDIIAAPKALPPLNFVDPIDLSTLSNTTTDSLPSRFTIAGDSTVFTNVLISGAGGLSRLIFKKVVNEKKIKFILGQRSCGGSDCAVTIPTDGSNSDDNLIKSQYTTKLDIYVGPEITSTDITTAAMPARKIFSDTFSFSPGDDRRTFSIDSGRAIVDAGKYIFFVASTTDEDGFFIDAIGGGNIVWSTTSLVDTTTFYQHYTPFTLPPNAGLFANVYYEGTVALDKSAGTCDKPIGGQFEIIGGSGNTVITATIPATGIPIPTPVPNYVVGHTGQVITQVIPICRDTIISSLTLAVLVPSQAGCAVRAIIYKDNTVYCAVGGQYDVNGLLVSDRATGIPAGNPGEEVLVTFEFDDPKPIPKGNCTIFIEAFVGVGATQSVNLILPLTDNNPDGIVRSTGISKFYVNNGQTLSSVETVFNGVLKFTAQAIVAPITSGGNGGNGAAGTGNVPSNAYIIGETIKLTTDGGKHPRLSKDKNDNLWLVFHSDRTGNNEVYITKFFADCGQWASSTQGGNEYQLSNAGITGHSASFPNSVCDTHDEVNIVWQSDDSEDDHSEIFYSKSIGGGAAFKKPIRLTTSIGDALMPDIALSYQVNGEARLIVVWHDSRYGAYEIMGALLNRGVWLSSGQGKFDVRITSAPGDSMFPRVYGDTKANVRIVWQDNRRGPENPGIYMATYVGTNNSWACTGQGGSDILISLTGTRSSLFPDVATDLANGVFIVWQDDRLALTNPDQHEEIFGAYCARQDAVLVHYAPIKTTNVEAVVQTDVMAVDCEQTVIRTTRASKRDGSAEHQILFTSKQNICLQIKSAGATYYRVANEDGGFGPWTPFVPTGSLDTTIIPWTISPGNGTKTILVQTQTDQAIGFPVSITIIYQSQTPRFTLGLYSDPALTIPLPNLNGIPVTGSRDVFMNMFTGVPLKDYPTFDVVSRGRSIMNQRMDLIPQSSGATGVTGFSGINPNIGASAFKGSFKINKDDGLFYLDGPARIIPHGIDIYGNKF